MTLHVRHAVALSLCLSLALASNVRAAPESPPPASPPVAPSIVDTQPPTPTPTPSDTVESVFDLGLDAPPPPPPDDTVEPAPTEAPVVQPTATDELAAPTPRAAPSTKKRPPPGKLGIAGWSSLLVAFGVGATASLFVGFSERERNRSRRISIAYDLFTEMPRPVPDDIAALLVTSRTNRVRYQRTAVALGATAGGFAITAGVLLIVEATRRRKRQRASARLTPVAGGATLRF